MGSRCGHLLSSPTTNSQAETFASTRFSGTPYPRPKGASRSYEDREVHVETLTADYGDWNRAHVEQQPDSGAWAMTTDSLIPDRPS